MYTLDDLRADNEAKWQAMRISALRKASIESDARRVIASRARLMVVERLTGVPWFVAALLDLREENLRMSGHLHNGDGLKARTVHAPRNRPVKGNPPFTFEESAVDALTYDGLAANHVWDVAGIAYFIERYNGFGYRDHGRASSYLWAGCQHYVTGKYVADGKYDPRAVDKQNGCMVVLRAAMAIDPTITLGGTIATSAPTVTDTVRSRPWASAALATSIAGASVCAAMPQGSGAFLSGAGVGSALVFSAVVLARHAHLRSLAKS